MVTYFIYEVPGHKNGATMQWDVRTRQNFNKYGVMPIVIETMEGPNEPEFWQIVGDREWELADQNGYPRGEHYRIAREKRPSHPHGRPPSKQTHIAGGRAVGSKNGKKCRVLNSQQCIEIRNKFNTGNYPKYKLAEEYGVGRTTILRVITNLKYER